jgi:hypothetical protein
MKLTLKVETATESYEVTTSLYNVVEWERRTKRKASELAGGVGYEDLAFLAYAASKTNSVTVPIVFDDFVKSLTNLEVVENAPENPTLPAPTEGN